MRTSNTKCRKVTINLPVSIFKELEKRYTENGTNITTEIIILLKSGLEQQKTIETLPSILEYILQEQKSSKKSKTKTK